AHELAHIVLDHHVDTKYSFHDRMLFPDEDTFRTLIVRRDENEEREADDKAIELLRRSPYSDKLGNDGLFLKALQSRAGQIPNLLRPQMGNPIATGGNVLRMKALMDSAPELEPTKTDQIAALPLGGRIRVDPWTNTINLAKTEPVTLQ